MANPHHAAKLAAEVADHAATLAAAGNLPWLVEETASKLASQLAAHNQRVQTHRDTLNTLVEDWEAGPTRHPTPADVNMVREAVAAAPAGKHPEDVASILQSFASYVLSHY